MIVSEEPLMASANVFQSTPGSPFVHLSNERVEELLDQLANVPEESWDAGMLAFVVE